MAFVIPSVFTAVDKITAPLIKMAGSVNVFAARIERRMRSVRSVTDSAFEKLTGGYGGRAVAAGIGVATFAVTEFVKEASKIEDAQAQFTPLLKGPEKAAKMVDLLNKAAAKTPFEFEHMTSGAAKLLPAMRGDMEKTVSTLMMLGDTAGGNAEKLDSIVRGYSKALLKGKVDMESLNMIGEAGVPIVSELASTMGYGEKEMGKFFKRISAGKVSTADLEKTLKRMTGKGGLFFNAMSIASKTLSGKISTMKDTVKMAFASIGQEISPYIKDFVDKITVAATKIQEWVKANKKLIGQKVKSFFETLSKVISFIANNFDTIVFAVKAYVSALIVLKAISIAAAIATWTMEAALFAYNVAIGITGALTGVANINIGKSVVAMTAYKVATWILTAAQWGLSAAQWAINTAMSANPFVLVTIAIIAMAYVVYKMIKHWDEWGAAASFVLMIINPGLAFMLMLVQSLRKHWSAITKAFSEGSILDGIKSIGLAIVDSVLYPLEQLLSLIDKVAGTSLQKELSGIRASMGIDVSNIADKQEGIGLALADRKDINNSMDQALVERSISENFQKVLIDINDKSGASTVRKQVGDSSIPIKLNSTMVR